MANGHTMEKKTAVNTLLLTKTSALGPYFGNLHISVKYYDILCKDMILLRLELCIYLPSFIIVNT